ncbi:cytochrome-c peroxidase [Massilia sp. 9096]|uniref:cytochrome-c peroxidase n=1 Tax=Massilia sp. 9096 TaxID=1500894 RepID=UPI000690041E|nr:cytochrome c peroxidase [Massilia sp. 9096]
MLAHTRVWTRAATAALGMAIACAWAADLRPAPGAGVPAAAATATTATIGTTAQLAAMPATPAPFQPSPARAALGRQVFYDARLSEPAGTSCAACHDPHQGFAGNHGSTLGVALGSRPGSFGTRNVPSALYAAYVPRLFFYQDDDAPAPIPFGGLFADGRADTVAELVRRPLLDPLEMHNLSADAIARKLRNAPYADGLRKEFGPASLQTTAGAMAALGAAMEAFLQSREMAPFSSRYDAWVQGKGRLSEQELRGLKLFKDPDRGNCASCHRFNETARNPARSMFTDFGYDAIGAPRNAAIPANRDPRHVDEGLCATAAARRWPDSAQWCGYFRTPSLRNVAARERYMHNGVFADLRDAVAFYATRTIEPRRWYRGGRVFDDVAPAHRANVNVATLPLNRRQGMQPALGEQDIDAILAFLQTLTDAPFEEAAQRNMAAQAAHRTAQARR